jgi:subtilisin-like proprotein convertase family protein
MFLLAIFTRRIRWHRIVWLISLLLLLGAHSSVAPSATQAAASNKLTSRARDRERGSFSPNVSMTANDPFGSAWMSNESDTTQGVAWGDVDRDGDLDLAVGNYGRPNRLYRNEDGTLTASAVWSSSESGNTTSVAWGDVDGDGDLDLAVGNAGKYDYGCLCYLGQPNRLYRNDNGILTASAVYSTTESDNTYSVAWGDVDGDGDLDLAVGNHGHQNRLYRNDGGTLTASAVWSSSQSEYTNSVAWGDVDGDGDLDLAVGNEAQFNRVYRNNGGTLTASPVWSSSDTDDTYSVAWGDVDDDGDLDLAVGNWLQPNRVYQNNGGTLTTGAFWSSSESDMTTSVAWGDMDADGDLDLVTGTYGGSTRLYRNDNGLLTISAAWSSNENDITEDLAWGDVDRDGDLDLAVGNWGQPNRLYRNNEGILEDSAVWSSNQGDETWKVAWGDVDGDGDLDLAAAWGPNRLYRNDGGTLTTNSVWSSTENSDTNSIAWGDVDGDGDLDLAVGNDGDPNRLYQNNNGVLTTSPIWSSSQSSDTYSVAWGDVDNDGDLDLATGNTKDDNYNCACFIGQPISLYRNNNGALTTSPVWSSSEGNVTFSVAWGDVDNDGDLDLAIGNYGEHNRLYRNDNGTLAANTVWSSNESDNTNSVAWGDVDGDGDLDLAAGNYYQPNRLYRNDDGILTTSAVWSSIESDGTTSLVWGDVDGDGDLDLAVGNYAGPNRIYLNNGGTLMTNAAWSSSESYWTQSIALGDVDGDGDLDLAAGNYLQPNRLHWNTRDARQLPGAPVTIHVSRPFPEAADYSSPFIMADQVLPITYTLTHMENNPVQTIKAFYSLNGGGQWQPAVAASGTLTTNLSTATYNIKTGGNNTLISIPDLKTITSTSNLASTGFIADIDVTLSLTHTWDSNLVITLTAPFSQSVLLVNRRGGGGDNFTKTTFDDEAPTAIGSGSPPFTGHYRPEQALSRFDNYPAGGDWTLTISDIASTQSGTLASWGITVTLNSGVIYTYNWDIPASGFFGQSDNVVFRLQAIPAITHIPNSIPGPYLYGSYASSTFPFRVRGTQVRVMNGATPAMNALVYRLPAGQAQGAEAFAGAAGQPFHTDGQGYLQGRGTLNIGDQLIALVPITTTEASTLYYTSASPDTTGLNAYTVTTSGVQTLTVSANNPLLLFNLNVSLEWDARQDATFLERLKFDLGRASEFLYDWTNGQVALGKLTIYHNREHWNDAHLRIYGSNGLHPNADQGGITLTTITETVTSNLGVVDMLFYRPGQVRMAAVWDRFGSGETTGEDWSHALAHELSHYLLFLDDAYLGVDAAGKFYPLTKCAGTAMTDPYRQDYSEFKPLSNWSPACDETLAARTSGRSEWTTIRRFYPALFATSNVGPSLLPLAVTQFQFVEPVSPTTALAVPVFYLSYANARYVPGGTAKAILYQPDQGRLLDLGHPVDDRITAYGARPNDRLCVYDPDVRKMGCKTVTLNDPSLTLWDIPAAWQPDIRVRPVTTRTVEVLVKNAPIGVVLQTQLYPDNDVASSVVTLPERSAGVYSATVTLSSPTLAAQVQVWVNELAPRREAISAYALGGNPASPPKKAPKRAPVTSNDGEVTILTTKNFLPGEFYALQRATYMPTIPVWTTQVGPGYRLLRSLGAPDLSQASISFNYTASMVPSGEENFLQVYYYQEASGQWVPLATQLDTDGDAAIAPMQNAGLYALLSSFNIPLVGGGWNLFAYPVQATRAITTALQSIAGNYSLVYSYVPTETQYSRWKVYAPNAASYVNTLHTLEFGKGYWINITDTTTLRLKGTAPAFQMTNASFSLPPATYYGKVQAGSGFTPTAGMAVTAWINGVLCGQGQMLLDHGQVVYALQVLTSSTGALSACGADGRVVQFKAGSYTMQTTIIWDDTQAWEVPLHAALVSPSVYLPLVMQ